jgi:tetratricopeptide (TPR) repeat protein
MPKQPAKKSVAKKAKKAPASPQALVQEMMRLLEQRLGPNDLIMPEDMQALITSLEAPQASDQLSEEAADARAQAQDFAFSAMEAESEAQARKLAKRALKLDPDCVDALLIMVDVDAQSSREMLDGLQKAVAAGERSLGAKFIDENEGRFWLLIETRPYMRALQVLAEGYRSQGISMDAIRIFEKILKLNPNDNQGVRDPLLGLYLETGDLNGAALLLHQYRDDASASFAWARVLERFLAGDGESAAALLAKARKANRHVEVYLTTQKPLPDELPEMYAPGSEEEAVLCLSYLGGAWAEHEDAASWLFDQLARPSTAAITSKAALKKLPSAGKRMP